MEESKPQITNNIYLENLSVRAFNVCKSSGFDNVEQVMEYLKQNNSFLNLKNCGENTDNELTELCLKYGFQWPPGNEANNILEPYFQLRLNYLKPYLPNALFKYLITKNIKTIGDFFKLDYKHFITTSNLSVELNERFRVIKNTIEKRPHRIIAVIESHKDEIILPIKEFADQSVLSHDFLSAYQQVLNSFISILKDAELETIIKNRFGLEETKNTLEEIALFFNKTREWVRINEIEFTKKLTALLSGNNLDKPFCSCMPEYIACINHARTTLFPNYAIEKSILLSIIKNESTIVFDKYRSALFDSLVSIWNFKSCTFRNREYILCGTISENLFLKTAKAIIDFLSIKVIACSKFEIVIDVKKKVGRNVSNEFIYELLANISDITKKDDGKYEIDFNSLPNVKEKAYRILYEKQDTMPYKEIWRELNHRLVSSGNQFKPNISAMTNQLCQDNRFVPIGKSGVWGLSEWNINTDTIIELISKFLHSKNAPVTLDDITDYIKSIRPRTDKSSIISVINLNPDNFARINDGKFILKDWETAYDTNYVCNRSEKVPDLQLYKTFKGIFEAHDFNFMSSEDVLNALAANGIKWAFSTLYARINKCDYILKKTIGSKNLLSFDRAAPPPVNKNITHLSEEIRIKIKDFLTASKEPIAVADIIRELKKDKYNRATIYQVISKSPEFIKSTINGNKPFVSLQNTTSPSLEDLKNGITNLASIISKGENDKIEFKSSLRWDFRQNRINQVLELMVAKTIAGFLNTRNGTLFIGVNDNSEIIGLEHDYKTFKKGNCDGFMLHFNTVITNHFSKEVFSNVLPTIEVIAEKDVCIVEVKKAPGPVYLNNNKTMEFYIRAGSATHKLDIQEAVAYVKANW